MLVKLRKDFVMVRINEDIWSGDEECSSARRYRIVVVRNII